MPRNVPETPADTVIAARIDGDLARCGRCGQLLWRMDGDTLSGFLEHARGRRLDVNGVWRPTAEQSNERKRQEAHLQDPHLSRRDREIRRRRLATNDLGRGIEHTDDSPRPLPTEPLARGRIVITPPTAGLSGSSGGTAEDVPPGDPRGRHAGTYRMKERRRLDELSLRLALGLRLPAKVQCPRCPDSLRIVNLIEVV